MEKPLALKMAPKSIKDVVGQTHLIGPNKILTNLVKSGKLFSMILYGNPGIGKTSIANAIVNDLKINYRFLNATINNKKDFETVFEEAKMYDGMVLIVDEIHRLNKDKQDLLLPCLESGLITLIGLTTSNPYHVINPAIRSRCTIFKLEPLTKEDILKALNKAIKTEDLKGIKIDKKTLEYIATISKFDLRFAYNLLEISYYFNKEHNVTIDVIKSITGEFDADELVAMFKNFFFDKMILDITAIKNYKNLEVIQKLAMGLSAEKLILVIPDEECSSSAYLSSIISMGIYNFTNNVNAVKQLIDNPNSYKDVAEIQQLNASSVIASSQQAGGKKIIGVKNVTEHAGATTLIYMMKKELNNIYSLMVCVKEP